MPAALAPYLPGVRALIMDRHGSLTVGATLEEAYNRLEALEHSAKILHAAHQVGRVTPLSPGEAAKLESIAARARPPDDG